MSVLSVSTDLTVWCESGSFVWHEGDLVMTHPSDDPDGATSLIMRHYRTPEQPAEEDGRSPQTPRD
jgi:hypothetical protein